MAFIKDQTEETRTPNKTHDNIDTDYDSKGRENSLVDLPRLILDVDLSPSNFESDCGKNTVHLV